MAEFQQQAAERFWASLTDDEKEQLRRADQIHGDMLRRMTEAGMLLVGNRWEGDEVGFTFFMPEALIEIMERDAG